MRKFGSKTSGNMERRDGNDTARKSVRREKI